MARSFTNSGAPYTKKEDRIIVKRSAPGIGTKLFDDEIADALGRTVSGIRERRRVLRSRV